MCLTTAMLAAFLNMIAFPQITVEPGRIIVHATEWDAHWVEGTGDEWCTMAPQIDRLARFEAAVH